MVTRYGGEERKRIRHMSKLANAFPRQPDGFGYLWQKPDRLQNAQVVKTRLPVVSLRWAVAGAALLTLATPARAANFSVTISSPVGTPTCDGGGISTGRSSTPVSLSRACELSSVPGSLAANGSASFGHVGARGEAHVSGGYTGTSFGITTTSYYSDSVTFTSTDPGLRTVTVGGMNLLLSGVMHTSERSDAEIVASVAFGRNYEFIANQLRVIKNDFELVTGSVTGDVINASLRTGAVNVELNQQIFFSFYILAGAGVQGDGAMQFGTSDFGNGLEIPFDTDVFELPEGVTANAGDWLVNNRRVREVSAVPEPSTWATFIAGFGLVGAVARRRRFAT